MSTPADNRIYGLMAEFADVDALIKGARAVRDAGYRRWESYTPFPVHGLDRAMGAKPSRLPWLILCCGLTGMSAALFIVWWGNATSFPVWYALRGYAFVASGKPVFSLPANIPPIYEWTVLFSAFGSFFGMLALNRLFRYHHPLWGMKRFGRVTTDKFFIAIEARDPRFDLGETARLLRDAGAAAVEEVPIEED